jgi:putative nucleotidyltransferase with HDIG domain
MSRQLPSSGLKVLQKENDRLKVLLHLAQNLQTHLELDKLLFVTMEEVAKILEADRCSVFLLDENKKQLWSIVALGIEKGKEIRFSSEKGIAGYVAQTGEILNISDAYKDPRFNPQIDKKTGYRTRNLLTVPMRNKNQEIIGVFQILNKKIGKFTKDDEELLIAISQIAATTIENSLLYEEQVESLNSFVETLSEILDTRDYITSGHSKRVTLFALALCHQLELEQDICEQVRYAGLLHDIGKLSIPEAILFKNGKLTQEEYNIIKNHPAVTRQILESIHFPRNLNLVAEIASTHHENVNGNGYPDGLKDDEIPLGGKLLALADVFDALTSKRQYRDREPIEKIWSIIEGKNGECFDPVIVDVFLQIPLKKIIQIMELDHQEKINENDLIFLEDTPFQKLIHLKRLVENQHSKRDRAILEIFNKYYWKK